MPSLGDSAVIFVIALILFGPKKLPELARQLGKLMAEFRRASNEFRMQMDDELRVADQAEQQRKIAAMEAAAPVAPALEATSESLTESATGASAETTSSHEADSTAHPFPGYDESAAEYNAQPAPEPPTEVAHELAQEAPLPIASSGDLHIMPPSTGLPLARTSDSSTLSPVLDAIPHTPDPEHVTPSEPSFHG